ncbi:MAG: hypothetical protein AAF892_12355 [Cyanobacteria bacterium P01_D01_bin.71]
MGGISIKGSWMKADDDSDVVKLGVLDDPVRAAEEFSGAVIPV